MSKAKGIRVGVSDFYVAPVTIGDGGKLTFGTPKVLGGTASVSESDQKGENKVYESDALIHNGNRVSSTNVSYKSRTVDMADEMEILHGLTAADGEYTEGPDDQPKYVAVGWAAKCSDGSYKCVWYFYATGSKGDASYETATDAENSPEDEYVFVAMPRPDTGKLRRRKLCANKAEADAFFQTVEKASS